MDKPRLNYLELPAAATADAKAFYSKVFGWDFADFGPTYTAMVDDVVSIGFQADNTEKTATLLPVIEVDNLETYLERVKDSGGKITREIFAFPGGRRFHFMDKDGHELAVWQAAG